MKLDLLSNFKSLFNFNSDDKKIITSEGEKVEIDVTPTEYFGSGEFFPPAEHRERIDRYRRNKKIFKGNHFDVFKDYKGSPREHNLLYISLNLASIIAKKNADFLFGEAVQVVAGNGDSSKEQKALDKFVADNNLNILTYESALANAYCGDSFIKVRYGQEYGGELPIELDEKKVIIEPVNAEYVYPEASLYNANKVVAYHIAVPVQVKVDDKDGWQLFIESHYAGRIEYRVFNIQPIEFANYGGYNEVLSYKILDEVIEGRQVVNTGVGVPLVVHIPNYATGDSWEGIDDISEHLSLLDEINNRLSQIADILNKHSDPAMAIPSGIMGEDADGNPTFNVRRDKVFEVLGKEDVIPQYITWEGQLSHAFSELDRLIDLLLMACEIPSVALGKGDSGTSGSSGLAIKWRMNSLLAKINRKRQYYDKGLKTIFYIAQKLEEVVGVSDYDVVLPKFIFQDGLPKDDTEQATVMSIRTGGMKTISQKTAIMRMENMSEEQAELELERIKEEEEREREKTNFTSENIFNKESEKTLEELLKDSDKEDTSKHAEGNPVTDKVFDKEDNKTKMNKE